MSRILNTVLSGLAGCLLLLATLAYASDDHAQTGAHSSPSAGAKGMPGALGTFVFKPKDWKGEGHTSYWKDSDGVQPGVEGCHIGTDSAGKPNGRVFGEACLSKTVLVESNPEADKLHPHKDDIGHPDKFDCVAWCKGQKHQGGSCKAVSGPAPCASSAKCVCN